MSLRVKIALSLAVLAGIIAALASGGAYVTAARQLDRGIDETLITRARSAVSQPIRRDGPGSIGRPGERDTLRCPDPSDLQSLAAAQILEADGTVVSCLTGGTTIDPTANDLAIAAGTASDSDRDRYDDDDGTVPYHLGNVGPGHDGLRVITMAFPSGGAIQLARDTEESRRVLDGLQIRLLLIALTGIALAAGVGFLLATRIVRPIRRLTTTAEHIAATRDLTTPVPHGGSDEIGSLSQSFTTMVASLAESQDQQQRLISDASHEMRTPLTSLRTNLELLARAEQPSAGTLSPEDRRAVIEDLRFETGELTTLLTELVELATDRSGGELPADTDLAALCNGVAERARRRTGRPIAVIDASGAPVEEGTTLPMRQHMIERAVSNLIDNAVKYSPDGAAVDVIVDGGTVTVRDHGPGIAPDDLPRVFDRFYRATTARTEPGSGLGLAIVSQIVETHGGHVFAHNRADGTSGATVGFSLPTEPGR